MPKLPLFETGFLRLRNRGEILYHPGREGALLPPIVIDHVPHDSELVMEETFGLSFQLSASPTMMPQ